MSMDVWANVAILLMYESHDIRHRCFAVDDSQRDPRDLRHPIFSILSESESSN